MNKPKYFSITYDMSKLSGDEQKAVIAEASSLFLSHKAVCAGWENDGVTNNGWKSVDDEPPPELEEVLTLSIMNTYQILSLQNDGEYFDFARRESVRAGYITHWQPLPQPPKERMNDNH